VELLTPQQMTQNRHRISRNLRNYWKILKLRNLHKNQQCVVFATGPSIKEVDLSLIENHPFVLGVNGAFRERSHFKYYFCSDGNFYLPNETEIAKLQPDYFFLSSMIPFRPDPKYIYLKLDERSASRHKPMTEFRDNLLRTLSWGPTVLLDLVLPAVLWMGFTEIILLGADYPLKTYNHFYPETEHKVIISTRIDFQKEMVLARQGFQKFLERLEMRKKKVKVYNCSPLSELDCFEKRPLSMCLRG
jgi:hypothetical protein